MGYWIALQHTLFIVLLQAFTCLGTSLSPSDFFEGRLRTSMPRLQSLDVKCGRSGMTVNIYFDLPFHGVIYSKGHFYDNRCNYVADPSSSETTFTFLIPIDSCGTVGNLDQQNPYEDMYFENVVVIQNDPLIQEIWDEARLLRCTWQHTISKSVTASPFSVEDPEMVSLHLDSRSINTLMKIQKGASPFDSPATGYVHVGDDTSIVIYVQASGGTFDANVVSCTASTGKGNAVKLIDEYGCLVRPDLLTPFHKMKHPNNIEADIMFYSYLRAFRIGENVDFQINCKLEVCENSCLDPCVLGPLERRRKRSVSFNETVIKSPTFIELKRGVIVVPETSIKEEKLSNCYLNSFASSTIALFVLLFAFLASLTTYLGYRLRVLESRLNS